MTPDPVFFPFPLRFPRTAMTVQIMSHGRLDDAGADFVVHGGRVVGGDGEKDVGRVTECAKGAV